MRRLTDQGYWTWRRGILTAIVLLLGFMLAGCGGSLFGATARPIPEQVSVNLSDSSEPTLDVSPATGSGGVYVQVRGAHWPQNMLVLITLEDNQGSSSTLASSNTDQAGSLTTGFLYPIDERWLADGSRSVVATTADGRVETRAQFVVVPPGEAPAMASTTPAKITTAVTETAVLSHVVSLPTLLKDQPVAGVSTNESRQLPASNPQQVVIEIAPGNESLDCDDERAIFAVAILTTPDFDATSVDPGTVTVASGRLSNTTYGQDSPVDSRVEPVKRGPKHPKNNPNPRAKRAPLADDDDYEWFWYWEDVDHDGNDDMVMQFRLSYTELTCDAAVVTLAGRTKDGRAFEGRSEVPRMALDEG